MDANQMALDGRVAASVSGTSGEGGSPLSKATPAWTASPARPQPDRVELSAQGKAWAPYHPVDAAPETGAQGPWERDRLSRLDQMELLVQKGRYNVTPYMVDEIAVRLARSMIAA